MSAVKFFVIILFITLLNINNNAYSFTTYGKFPQNEILIQFSKEKCSESISMSPKRIRWAVQKAVSSYWNSVEESSLRLIIGESVDVKTGDISSTTPFYEVANKNTILVACSNSLVAFTNSSYKVFAGSIYGEDEYGEKYAKGVVILNDRFTSNIDGENLEAMIPHLARGIGHAFGLGHSSSLDALMRFGVNSDLPLKLHEDDINGVTYLYPKK